METSKLTVFSSTSLIHSVNVSSYCFNLVFKILFSTKYSSHLSQHIWFQFGNLVVLPYLYKNTFRFSFSNFFQALFFSPLNFFFFFVSWEVHIYKETVYTTYNFATKCNVNTHFPLEYWCEVDQFDIHVK